MTAMHTQVLSAYTSNNHICDSWGLFFDKLSGYSTKNDQILGDVILQYEKQESKKYLQGAIASKWNFYSLLAKRHPDKVRILFFENVSRLFVNMGHSQVIENAGFSFERITGIPNVPGTALKGVVSTWAIWEGNADNSYSGNLEVNRSKINKVLVDIFGANEDDDACEGKINFYGLFPLEVPTLVMDIFTPHQGEEPEHQRKINPKQFLTVESGTIWFCPIMFNRENDYKEAKELFDKTEQLIERCLKTYGVGAKVAAGYGKFDVADPERIKKAISELEKAVSQKMEKIQEAQKVQEIKKMEEERCAALPPEELAAEKFERGLNHSDITGDIKGKMFRIAELSAEDQKSLCILLRGKYSHIWQEDLKDAQKAGTQSEKNKAKNKGFKRVNAVRPIAKQLGVDLQ